MNNFIYLSILVALSFLVSCDRTDEILTTNPNFRLTFSLDTIAFDTVFTLPQASDRKDTIKSIFKRLLVYNMDENAVNIERIQLSNPAYTAIVLGEKGRFFEDVKLLGKDSLQILVSVNINPSATSTPFLVSDQLTFITNGNPQGVDVVSWGQNAEFLEKQLITVNTTWTNNRPYILLDTVFIDVGVTLTVNPGTRIYADHLAGLFIGGNILVNGSHEERVLFRNLRTGIDFDNQPGQWTGLVFGDKSHDNLIEYADIRNAINGIFFGAPDDDDTPDLIINNCKIENMAGNIMASFIDGYGVLAFSSDIEINNTLINSCVTSSVGLLAGGNYQLNHCTMVSLTNTRSQPTAVITNFVVLENGETISDHLQVNIVNSIIWGNMQNELLFSQINDPEVDFFVNFEKNLVKTTDNSLIDSSNIINEDPLFSFPREYNYHVDGLSPVISKATSSHLTKDLDDVDRLVPDIGAYEWVDE